MARRERDLEAECCKLAESCDLEHIKLDLAKRGWPDRLYFLPDGKTLLVEFKMPGEKPRKKQKAVHGRLNKLGHTVHVIFSRAAFARLLKRAIVTPL